MKDGKKKDVGFMFLFQILFSNSVGQDFGSKCKK